MMNSNSPLQNSPDEYIEAAPDTQLSSSQSNLLSTLLNEEDQHDYNQLLFTQLPKHIHRILYQLSSFLHLSSSTTWMATILIKKLIIQQHSFNLLTIIASLTLSYKYQHTSTHSINYQQLAQYFHIKDIQHIHDTELHLLDLFSYDICVTTPDHFFSYLSNLNNHFKLIVQQTQSFLSIHPLSHQTFELLHNYPCSIVVLSLMYNITSNTFIIQQIKSFLHHKKDPCHYLSQLTDCIIQLRNILSQ